MNKTSLANKNTGTGCRKMRFRVIPERSCDLNYLFIFSFYIMAAMVRMVVSRPLRIDSDNNKLKGE